MFKNLTCIECPMGCEITVQLDGDKVVSIVGNSCPRGKAYANDEVICPKRILTTTVKCENGKLVSVKTDKAVEKSKIFDIMDEIKNIVVKLPVKIGDVVKENISGDANLIATSNEN